tara:strand:- start:2714 stop:2839 length:126 start_codon:yes stop_codon:yes gene_type:complete
MVFPTKKKDWEKTFWFAGGKQFHIISVNRFVATKLKGTIDD